MRARAVTGGIHGRIKSTLGAALLAPLFFAAGCGGEGGGGTGEESGLAETHLATWSHAGADGPDEWASLDPAYATCGTGERQSPIDIVGAKRRPFPPVELDYAPVRATLIDNGHAIEAELEDSGSSARIGGDEFTLEQFHFHMPAEEVVGGKSFAASIHLVHLDEDGGAAVVGLLVEPGPENPVIERLAEEVPEETDEPVEVEGELDLAGLVPDGDAFRYEGSLTTPPCTEGITWTVFEDPVTMSPEQLEAFAGAYDANARPVQARNGREISVGPGLG